eukprot:73894-Amphidinium_carterae.1
MAIRIRQEAVLAKIVKELPAEADLVSGPTSTTWTIAESLVLGPKKARALLWEKISDDGKKDKKDKKEQKEKDGVQF